MVYSTPLEISIKASTVWGSSSIITIYSPIPSAPTNIRVFGNYSKNNQTIDVILQHSSIKNITHYEIMCHYQANNYWKVCSNQTVVSISTRTIWPGLAIDTDFLFKVILYLYLLLVGNKLKLFSI